MTPERLHEIEDLLDRKYPTPSQMIEARKAAKKWLRALVELRERVKANEEAAGEINRD